MTLELVPGSLVATRYRLERILGRGGMGVVWAATHTVTERAVALKFLHGPTHHRPELRTRFLREARAAAAVGHPNVVEMLDVFELDDQTPVMVMERLSGETLAERLAREHRLNLPATASALVPVISAVGTAHARGIVHRDLKPENVFLVKGAGSGETVKVLDFGIAKLVGVTAGEGVTETGSVLGTPCYMAPEQAVGEKDVDHRADVWAIGIMLYECLSGTKPIEGETLGKVLVRLLNDKIPPLRDVVGGLPEDVTDLVTRMLMRERGARPSDLREALDTLERHTSVRAPRFGPPGTGAVPELAATDSREPPGVDVNAPTEARSNTERAHAVTRAAEPRSDAKGRLRRAALATAGVALVVGTAAAIGVRVLDDRTVPPPVASARSGSAAATVTPTLRERALTASPSDNPVWEAALSPDGTRFAYRDATGIWLAPVSGGVPERLAQHEPPREGVVRLGQNAIAFMPDGRSLAMASEDPRKPDEGARIKLMPLHGGPVRELPLGGAGSVRTIRTAPVIQPSRDGREIAVGTQGGLLAVDVAGGQTRQILGLTGDEAVLAAAFSLDGSRLAVVIGHSVRLGSKLAVVRRDGSDFRILLDDPRLASARSGASVAWRDDRRLLFGRQNEVTEPIGAGLWQLEIGDGNEAVGQPRRLKTWDRVFPAELHTARDASRIIAVLSGTQGDVLIGDLLNDGAKLANVRRMTLHDGDDRPSGWLQDGRVLFMSDRYGTWDVLAQKPDTGEVHVLAQGRTWETWPERADKAVLFWRIDPRDTPRRTAELIGAEAGSRERRLLELPMENELRREAMPPPEALSLRCASAERLCVLAEAGSIGYTWRKLDPTTSRLSTPFYERRCERPGWSLSPDGRTIGIVALDIAGLVLVSVDSGEAREVRLAQGSWQTAHFMPDGKHLMLSGMNVQGSPYAIARTDLHGRTELIYRSQTTWVTQPLPSPDGRQLAFGALSYGRNVHLLEGL